MAKQAARCYIYRNLSGGEGKRYSIRYKGRVIAHSDTVWVASGEFHVSSVGRERVRREHKKYVHAFIVAEPEWVWWPSPYLNSAREKWENNPFWWKVSYNPYEDSGFVAGPHKIAITYANGVALNKWGVYAIGVDYTE